MPNALTIIQEMMLLWAGHCFISLFSNAVSSHRYSDCESKFILTKVSKNIRISENPINIDPNVFELKFI